MDNYFEYTREHKTDLAKQALNLPRILREQLFDGWSIVHRCGEREEVPARLGHPRFLLGITAPLHELLEAVDRRPFGAHRGRAVGVARHEHGRHGLHHPRQRDVPFLRVAFDLC